MNRLITTGLIFGLIVAVVAIGCDQPSPPIPKASAHKGGPTIGGLAPEISGVDLEGAEFKLSDYRGQVIMLDFYGDW